MFRIEMNINGIISQKNIRTPQKLKVSPQQKKKVKSKSNEKVENIKKDQIISLQKIQTQKANSNVTPKR